MRVIVPFTEVHPTVRNVLVDLYKLEPEFRRMDGLHTYYNLLREIWEAGETVTIIEHDVLPWPGAVEELNYCPGDWCSCTYKINGGYGIHHAFGCTKISGKLMLEFPDIILGLPSHQWYTLDAQLCLALGRVGHIPHPHRPPAIHLKNL